MSNCRLEAVQQNAPRESNKVSIEEGSRFDQDVEGDKDDGNIEDDEGD